MTTIEANIIYSCVYLRGLNDGFFIHLLLYNYMLIASKNKYEINKVKKLLNGESEMKDLGAAKKILGIKIRRYQKTRKLFLKKYYNALAFQMPSQRRLLLLFTSSYL